jgi:hypothetical protein
MKHLICILYRLKHFFCKCEVDEHEEVKYCGDITGERNEQYIGLEPKD